VFDASTTKLLFTRENEWATEQRFTDVPSDDEHDEELDGAGKTK
jgi:hypothetical protein